MKVMNNTCMISPLTIRQAARLLALAAFCSSAVSLRAGDAIVFSNEKGKTTPGKEYKSGGGLFDSWQKAPPISPFNDLIPSMLPPIRNLDPKTARRLRNAEDEKRNWMILDPGELQDKDDQNNLFGVHDENLDGLDEKHTGRDYTFYGLAEPKSAGRSSRSGSQSRTPGRPNSEQQANQRAVEAGKLELERRDAATKRERTPPLGAHTAGELNLRSLFEPTKSEAMAGSAEKSDFSLRDLLSNNSQPARSQEQERNMQKFKDFLNTSSPADSGPGLQPNLPAQSFNSSFPKPLEFTPARSGPNPFNPGSRSLTPGLSDNFPKAPMLPGFSQPPASSARSAEPRAWAQPYTPESTRRK